MATLKWRGGRFGNQLHLVAATYALSLDMNEPCEIPPWEYSKEFLYYHRCVNTVEDPQFSNEFSEDFKRFLFMGAVIPQEPKTRLHGWFESAKFFEGREKEVKHLFWQATKEINATGIHVRKTDFLLDIDHHRRLGMAYYKKAMDHIGDSRYIVCSDDVGWCKKHFVGPRFEFSNGSEIADFKTLRGCTNLIIANSTFSWWAAYLRKGNGTVVSPKKWHKRGPNDWFKTANTNWVLI